jgi:hypothetical protein
LLDEAQPQSQNKATIASPDSRATAVRMWLLSLGRGR